MNRARWITSAATFLALWLLGALVLAGGLRDRLETAAREALGEEASLHGRLDKLKVTFEGQEARLSGTVRTAHDREAAARVVRHLVRAPLPLFGRLGTQFNPVAAVHDEIEIAPHPPGWLLLAATGPEARLLGSAASEHEARDLARSLQETWSSQGGRIEGMPEVDATHHDEADNVAASLRGLPAPRPGAAVHVARIGGPWQTLPLERPDEGLQADLVRQGVTTGQWQDQVRPVLHAVRQAHEAQRKAAEEERRLAALPPGHVFIASRNSEVTLRGELATEAVKRALLDEALLIFAPFRVNDEIRVSSRRRPGDDFPPLTTALLPPDKNTAGGKALFLGFDHAAWEPVDWQVSSDAQPWNADLPLGLPAELLREDSAAVINWLQGAARPAPPVSTRSAFITLALFDGRAVLCGRVAEESTRLQIIAAARRAYAARMLVMHDSLRVDGGCRPFRGLLHTVKSLPPPPDKATEGIFALAVPAESWVVLPVTADLVEAGGLHRTGRFSPTIPASLVEERSQEALEQLRTWLALLAPQGEEQPVLRSPQSGGREKTDFQ